MTETLTVRRWSRFGTDRLVVTGDTGAQLGWIDLRSGAVVADGPLLEANLRRAAQAFLRADVRELSLPMQRGSSDPVRRTAAAPAPTSPPVAEASELCVADRLAQLVPEGWLVLHDVPVGRQGGVLDHLLIGPGGVYAIREHRHPSAAVLVGRTSIVVAGRPTHYLRDAGLEQRRVAHLLGAAAAMPVAVRAVIVLGAGAPGTLAGAELPDAALVLTQTDLPDVFRRLPRRLAATKVEAIRGAAGRRATWTS